MITKENAPVAEDYGYGSIKRVLITEEEIAQAVKKTGQLIPRNMRASPCLSSAFSRAAMFFLRTFAELSRSPARSHSWLLKAMVKAPFPQAM